MRVRKAMNPMRGPRYKGPTECMMLEARTPSRSSLHANVPATTKGSTGSISTLNPLPATKPTGPNLKTHHFANKSLSLRNHGGIRPRV
ncbi:hypothetical protein PIB30_063511 [Stylosanthes scabra]|uniref:Uncharacterized protein n=1 Tax=Stylosanthes scabra TaxID=79078 RepID=A0ABU6UKH9_9FABA|nr:hypothetical protein [Stylosanthes scabra]